MKDKLSKKYYALIWIGLIFSTLLCDFVSYYDLAFYEYASTADLLVSVLRQLLSTGFSVALVFLLALILYSMGFRRYIRCISRNDFCYWVMAFIAIARFIVGIITVFSLLEPSISLFTSGTVDVALEAAALFVMFFAVFKKQYKLNPVEAYNSFRFWGMVYVIVLGVLTLIETAPIFILAGGGTIADAVYEALLTSGYIIVIDDLVLAAYISDVCVYVAILITYISLAIALKKKAKRFRDPETREEFYKPQPETRSDDISSAYSDLFGIDGEVNGKDGMPSDGGKDAGKKDGNVFDEFDI